MKTKSLIRNALITMVAFVFFFTVEGCRKSMMDDSLSPSEIATLNSMRDAYVNAKTYNDSLISCSQNSSNQSNNMMAACINQQTLQHDSVLCRTLRMHYDEMYHQQDSMFNYYHNLCHQQMGNHCSGNMMSGGMMNGNNGNPNHCQINNTDYRSAMNSLHQLHTTFHP